MSVELPTLRLLEIGPGADPVISRRFGEVSWLPYGTEGGLYTCVQPPEWRGMYQFPDKLREAPRVEIIEGYVEDLDPAVHGSRYDEVYAKDVLCDPGASAHSILHAIPALLRTGGTVSFWM